MQENQTPPLVFISYRRSESSYEARIIKEKIERLFPPVFLDTEKIVGGELWEKKIIDALEAAKVLVVIIGSTWLDVKDPITRMPRIRMKNDWVRREIRYFLEQNKPILPICINHTPFPGEEELTEDIRGLRKFQSLPISLDHIDHLSHVLENALKACMKINLTSNPKKFKPGLLEENRLVEKTYPLPNHYLSQAHLQKIKAPYVGLHFFSKEEAPIYFGRDQEILRLINFIEDFEIPLLLMYGPSGVGKSSLLNAGLLPRIEGKFHFDEIHRRKYSIGLNKQLEAIKTKVDQHQGQLPVLVFLDQVEEMFTNKNPDLKEEELLFNNLLTSWVREIQKEKRKIKIVLSFRFEQYTKIAQPLTDRALVFQHMPLDVLNKDGILQAIKGVHESIELRKRFRLEIDESFAQEMVKRINNQPNESHIAPLLQLQLRCIWDFLCEEGNSNPVFDQNLFDRFIKKEGLSGMMQIQLDRLEKKWEVYKEGGLVLDLLNCLVTNKITAGQQSLDALKIRYFHIQGLDVDALILSLKNAYLVFETELLEVDPYSRWHNHQPKKYIRLAHDQLAEIVRNEYLQSNAPAQRAWRLIEAREGSEDDKLQFSEGDIDMIDKGRFFMQDIPEKIFNLIKRDRQIYASQRQNRFEIFLNNAEAALEHLDYEKALENLKLAANEGLEREKLKSLAMELPLIFHWTKNKELCITWTEWMKEEKWLSDNEIAQFPDPGSLNFQSKFKDWLKNLNEVAFNKLLYRHFPTMKPIKGGSFMMGSTEGWKSETPVHEVAVSDFKLGETSVTFWQYGLYCLLNGLTLPNDSGFGKGQKPVININWFEACKYCNWLSEWQGLDPVYENLDDKEKTVICHWDKNGYRLPTEAEWEYAACEGGKDVRFGNGKQEAKLSEINYNGIREDNYWFGSNKYTEIGSELKSTNQVFQYPPNQLGLYDMSGNVNDWCWDKFLGGDHDEDEYYKSCLEEKKVKDPKGSEHKSRNDYQVIKGGSWYVGAVQCRCAFRVRYRPVFQLNRCRFSGVPALAIE